MKFKHLFSIYIMFAFAMMCFYSPPARSQTFIRIDSLKAGDSVSVIKFQPYNGDVFIDVLGSKVTSKVDSLKVYGVPYGCDTGGYSNRAIMWLSNQFSQKNINGTDSLDTLLRFDNARPEKIKTWKLKDPLVYAIEVVRVDSLRTAMTSPVFIIIRATKRYGMMSLSPSAQFALKEKKALNDYQVYLRAYQCNKITFEEFIDLVKGLETSRKFPFRMRL
jgi:hypothetical protein